MGWRHTLTPPVIMIYGLCLSKYVNHIPNIALSYFKQFQPTAQPYDVISRILIKSSAESPSCIISSFSPTLSSKTVYVEALGGLSVLEDFLAGVAPILHLGSNRSRLSRIPQDEWSNIFYQPPQLMEDTISPDTWVRVHMGKIYHGDLGIVLEVLSADDGDMAAVLLVPRIQLAKNTSRPPRALFDESAVKNVYPARSIRRRNSFYEFKKKMYTKEGYLYEYIFLKHLTTHSVNPMEDEVLLFAHSKNPTVQRLYAAEIKKFRLHIHDRVRVHSGSLQDLTGYIVAIDKLDFVSIQEELSSNIFDVPIDEVEKFFLCGDTVRVLNGNHEGMTGIIISVDETTAELFDPTNITLDPMGEVEPPSEVRSILFLLILLFHEISSRYASTLVRWSGKLDQLLWKERRFSTV